MSSKVEAKVSDTFRGIVGFKFQVRPKPDPKPSLSHMLCRAFRCVESTIVHARLPSLKLTEARRNSLI